MGEVELQGLAVIAPGLAEEGDLKAEAVAVFGIEVSGDIPPLGAEFGVAAVVAWEGEDLSGLRQREAIRSGLRMKPRGQGEKK